MAGFFSDMSEDFEDDMGEVKPITPSKEIKNIEKNKAEDNEQKDLVSDDDFDDEEIERHSKQNEQAIEDVFEEDVFEIPEPEFEPEHKPTPQKVVETIKKVEKEQVQVPEEKAVSSKSIDTPSVKGETTISKDAVIQGDLTTSSSVVVSGEITGALKAEDVKVTRDGKVLGGIEGKVVSIEGQVKGEIKGNEIVVESSKINGNLSGTKSVSIGEKAIVVGNISSENLSVRGKIKGDLECTGIVDLKTGSVVKGNIKALEVLIDKGANFQGSIIKTGEIDDSLFE